MRLVVLVGDGGPDDDALLSIGTDAAVGLGAHAGDEGTTRRLLARAAELGLRTGLRPAYPADGGRTAITPETQRAWLDDVWRQIRLFGDLGATFLRPHAALHDDTSPILEPGWETKILRLPSRPDVDPPSAYLARYPGVQALAMFLRIARLPLLGAPGTAHEEIARRARQPFERAGVARDPSTALILARDVDAIVADGGPAEAEGIRIALESAGYFHEESRTS